MWNSHWCKWKYHVCRQCKRYLQHGSREGILPAVLWNLNHSSSSRTPACRKKKKKVAHILCENHTIHHLKTFWTGIGLLFNCQAEEAKKLDGFCTVTENEVYQISYSLFVNKSIRIFLNDLSSVLYHRNAAFLMLMCRHTDFSTTFITLWTRIPYPPLCQS